MTIDTIQATLNEHPELNLGGYGRPHYAGPRPLPKIGPDNYTTILLVAAWLTHTFEPARNLNRDFSSYALKHRAERALGRHVGFYVSNGEFICAALVAGFRMEQGAYNPTFALKTRAANKRVAA